MVGQNIGKYRVQDRIGRGGMGTVYRAIDETLHREVAIKVLNAELNDPEVARRFRAEAITVARLSHPGIATIYELFQHDGQWLMVMEFVRGETLERLVERTGPQPADRAAELCMQSLTALAHAHSMGVVHRDLKPANIMVTETGTVKIMDFGIARVAGTEHLTNAGFMIGTPAYMAPEQVLGHEIDARADLYTMGVVFYRLVTSQLPFKGETPFAMAQAQVNNPPTPIGTFRQDLPPWVDGLMTRSLAKKPEERFQSAVEFHEGFARSVAGQPIPTAYSSSAPTGLMMTPPRAVPTGSMEVVALSGSFGGAGTGTGSSPLVASDTGSASLVEGSEGAPTIAAGTPSATPRHPAGALLSSPTGAVGAGAPSMAPDAARITAPTAAVAEAARSGSSPAPAAVKGESARSGHTGAGKLIGIAAVALVAVGVGAFVMLRQPPEPPAAETAPAPTEVATEPAAPAAEPVAVPAAPTRPAMASGTPSGPSPNPAATAGGSGIAGASGRSTDPDPAAVGRGDSASARGGSGAPGRRGAAPPVDDSLLAFTDVRVMVVTGDKARDQEALLNFVGGQIAIVERRSGTALATLPYESVAAATYVRARDPRWNSEYASPPDGLDVGGMLRTSKHWLTLQNAGSYLILRLEDANVIRIIQAVETRTGTTVARPTSNDRD